MKKFFAQELKFCTVKKVTNYCTEKVGIDFQRTFAVKKKVSRCLNILKNVFLFRIRRFRKPEIYMQVSRSRFFTTFESFVLNRLEIPTTDSSRTRLVSRRYRDEIEINLESRKTLSILKGIILIMFFFHMFIRFDYILFIHIETLN